jgi:hypothetical protein
MAVWVVVLAVLADVALGTARLTAGIVDAVLLLVIVTRELVLVARRHRAATQPRSAMTALPDWAASPLLARPTPEKICRCGGLAASGGAGAGQHDHANSRHVA